MRQHTTLPIDFFYMVFSLPTRSSRCYLLTGSPLFFSSRVHVRTTVTSSLSREQTIWPIVACIKVSLAENVQMPPSCLPAGFSSRVNIPFARVSVYTFSSRHVGLATPK